MSMYRMISNASSLMTLADLGVIDTALRKVRSMTITDVTLKEIMDNRGRGAQLKNIQKIGSLVKKNQIKVVTLQAKERRPMNRIRNRTGLHPSELSAILLYRRRCFDIILVRDKDEAELYELNGARCIDITTFGNIRERLSGMPRAVWHTKLEKGHRKKSR